MIKKVLYFSLLICVFFLFTRCDDFFNTNPDDVLEGNDYVSSVNQLYSGYMGIASKVQAVGDHAIFLSELRGDLLEPTANAPQELWDIYNFAETQENSYSDPKGYYDIIINTNDYLVKAFEFKKKNPKAIEDAVFKPLISGVLRFKCWSYLMLAKLYGQVVYFDDPLVSYTDLSKFPVLDLNATINKCLELIETGVNGIDGKQTLVWSDILFPGQSSADLTWNMICPTPEPLLMELYLWAGNYQRIVEIAMPYIYDAGSKRYKLSNEDYNAEWSQSFYKAPSTKTRELINIIPYDYLNNQSNRLISYFSNTYPSKYYLRPTQVAMDRFNRQKRQDGLTIGDKYRGNEYTFIYQNGDWVIRKFSRERETADQIYKNDVHIPLYRASDIHFFLAEALNHLMLFPEAEAILNDGVEAYLSKYAGKLRYPFNNSVYNASLITNWGIRRRVDVGPSIRSMTSIKDGVMVDTLNTPQDTLKYMKAFDEALVEETCLESAAEARSYFAMIRIATKWNDPEILARRVSAKYPVGLREAVHARLMDKKNWFVNYDLRKQ